MGGGSPWIAIVDDDPSVLKALTRLLRTRSFQAKTNASAQAFLPALSEGPPECLILNLQMPEMNGLERHRHLALGASIFPLLSSRRTPRPTRASAAKPPAPPLIC
jgi:FixJ family two-component response regulator